MHVFEPINLEPQPFCQSIMDTTDWKDKVKTATDQQVEEILFALGWPTKIKPNILLCKMPPLWQGKIHLDESNDRQHHSVINIPVLGEPVLEWYRAIDESRNDTMYSHMERDIPMLALDNSEMIATTRGCGLAYIGDSGQWHRITNAHDSWAYVMSLRYIPESYERITQTFSRLPWVERLRNK